jgi:hypothetical protein
MKPVTQVCENAAPPLASTPEQEAHFVESRLSTPRMVVKVHLSENGTADARRSVQVISRGIKAV